MEQLRLQQRGRTLPRRLQSPGWQTARPIRRAPPSSAINAGSGKAFWRGAVSGALFATAGLVGEGANAAYSPQHFAAHAGAGCVSAVASGGNCGRGMASALVGKFVTMHTRGLGGDDIAGKVTRGAMATVAGGLASVAGGGKFDDGATTAAFGYLFNEMLTDKQGRSFKSRGRYYEGDRTMSGYDPGSCLCSSAPPTTQEIYEGFKIAATPLGIARTATLFIDLGVAGHDFYSNKVSDGALGMGSIAAGTGVEHMAKPIGKFAGPIGHIVGMGYDRLAKPDKQ